jgi:oligopeptide/dipeptide ABC transporter ATP-binding protein
MKTSENLIQVNCLKMSFHLRQGTVTAVEDMSFTIPRGRIIGLVGESGCGKSMTARALMRIEAPACIESGEILLNPSSKDEIRLHGLPPDHHILRSVRWKKIAMVFQEPMTSLGPMHTIGNQIEEAIRLHLPLNKKEARELAIGALQSVEMPRPLQIIRQYPHQISGGMRQRAMIAMALSCQPRLLIADEPTTALDASTESQILELLVQHQASSGMAVLYITHNLSVVAQIAEEVIVMYLGRVAEKANVQDLFSEPRHPYTRALLRSIPRIDQDPESRLETVEGDVPNPFNRPPGCAFHPRCPDMIPGHCDRNIPRLFRLGETSFVACHLYSDFKEVHNNG